MSNDKANSGKIAVITVHGTNDTAKDGLLDGEKWFQRGSTFATALLAALNQRNIDAEIVPFLWTGANSGQAREKAADKLADSLKKHRKDYVQTHIVGHSHGGNVANEAADFVRWGRHKTQNKERIDGIITVGTPFFKRSSSGYEKLGGLLFMVLTVLSMVMLLVFGVGILVLMATGELHKPAEGEAPSGLGEIIAVNSLLAAIFATNIVGMALMAQLAVSGVRRLLRPTDSKGATSHMTSIWHPNDEAIAFLQKVDQLPVAPLAKGALFDGSRTQAIIRSVQVVLLMGGAAIYQILIQGLPGSEGWWLPYGPVGSDTILPGLPDSMFFVALFTPLIFFGSYLAYRFLFGLLPEIFLRDGLNKAFGGALKSMAFGRDGDVTLSEVSTVSHTHPTEQVILKGETQKAMQMTAAGAAGSLIEKYRWSLLSVGTDPNAALQDLATDAMTWDSLIHTIYFDHPEVVEIIADRIAAAVNAKKPG
jgi:hypothetical protein